MCDWSPKWLANGWRKADGSPVVHRAIVTPLLALIAQFDVVWTHVAAHAGIKGNEIADSLSRARLSDQRVIWFLIWVGNSMILDVTCKILRVEGLKLD